MIAIALLAFASTACALDDPKVTEPPAEQAWPNLSCDPLVPSYCGYPFPSNVFTIDDPTSVTGRRVSIHTDTLPLTKEGVASDPSPFNLSDGFSTGTVLLAELPGATLDGLPNVLDIAASLDENSPTVLLEAETGSRVPHFVEIDQSTLLDETRSFMIRPTIRLKDATRYIVAIRGVRNEAGQLLSPSPAFAALRDLLPFDQDASVDARRGLYADIFNRLTDTGVARDDLVLAWDFTTASRESTTGWMTHMRDESLASLAKDGPKYVIDSVIDESASEHLAYRIEGHFTSPLYLDDIAPGGLLQFGDDGLPEPQGEHQVPFGMMIPKSALDKPAALLQYGHGLLGHYDQLFAGNFKQLANEYGYVIFGTTLTGMGDGDSSFIADVLSNGRVERLTSMFDRLHQGMLDQLLAMRVMRDAFSSDANYGAFIDPTERYYHGISQGGIFGGTYLALSTDVERGVLGVMGMPYNLLLNRSTDFNVFFALLGFTFPDSRDQQLLLSLVQMQWDRTEPNGYVPYLREGTPLGAPPHEVLMRVAVGDHQVTTLGGQLMARSAGAQHLDSGVREVFELEMVSSAEQGSGYVEYDFGLPAEPSCNIPMIACDDPHGKIRHLPAASLQLDTFLRHGRIENHCPDKKCSYPDLSGCDGDEPSPNCP